jgi:hypothetical protein
MADHDDSYEIGYKKPPAETRFTRGQSGNPKGRPKGAKNLATLLVKVGRERVRVTINDGAKLRELYERIIESSDADVDSFVTSEATKDFMARLRIGIMADQAPVSDPKDGPPTDIVFLQRCHRAPRESGLVSGDLRSGRNGELHPGALVAPSPLPDR